MAPLLEGPIPKVYKTEDWILNEKEGCIHMEDLSQKGKTFNYFESVNLEQIKSFIQSLAKIHKSNLSADPKIWKGKFVEDDQFFTFYHEILETQIEPFLKDCPRGTIVDWQIVHEGSQMADLARFLVHTADGNIRREAETFAFDFYLECLIKEFGGDSSKVPYNVEQLRKAYYYVFAL
uniref:CHK kinase-like domain-containing protein n=1 Tax=Panagrolaimus sp. PS1159 TaxID=55785 RepID=A0AC35GFV2_9BILA